MQYEITCLWFILHAKVVYISGRASFLKPIASSFTRTSRVIINYLLTSTVRSFTEALLY